MKKIYLVFLLAVFLIPDNNFAAVKHLTDPHRKLLENAASFRVLKSKSEMPASILVLCADPMGRMADIGEKWEPTDCLINPQLSPVRLIWAMSNGNYFLIHYERGGSADTFHILLAQIKDGDEADALWRAVGSRYSDMGAFIKALKNNQLDDNPKLPF